MNTPLMLFQSFCISILFFKLLLFQDLFSCVCFLLLFLEQLEVTFWHFVVLVWELVYAIFSAILVGFDESFASTTIAQNGASTVNATYGANVKSGRNGTEQGGFMIAGWFISVSFGVIAGGIVGLCYWFLDTR